LAIGTIASLGLFPSRGNRRGPTAGRFAPRGRFRLEPVSHTWFSTTEEANIPIAPTPQHSAKLIFEIFKAHSVQSGENLIGGGLSRRHLPFGLSGARGRDRVANISRKSEPGSSRAGPRDNHCV
jgi:hypothetical protein